jgi:hypothetical protein
MSASSHGDAAGTIVAVDGANHDQFMDYRGRGRDCGGCSRFAPRSPARCEHYFTEVFDRASQQ